MTQSSQILSPVQSFDIAGHTLHIFDNGTSRFALLDELVQVFDFPDVVSQEFHHLALTNPGEYFKTVLPSDSLPYVMRMGMDADDVLAFAAAVRRRCVEPAKQQICLSLARDLVYLLYIPKTLVVKVKSTESKKRRSKWGTMRGDDAAGQLVDMITHPYQHDKRTVRIYNVGGTRVAKARDICELIDVKRCTTSYYPRVGWVSFRIRGRTVIGHTASGVRRFAEKADSAAKKDLGKWLRDVIVPSVSDDICDDTESDASVELTGLKESVTPAPAEGQSHLVTEFTPPSDVTQTLDYKTLVAKMDEIQQADTQKIQSPLHTPLNVPADASNPIAIQCSIEGAVKEGPPERVPPSSDNPVRLFDSIPNPFEEIPNPFPTSTSLQEGIQQVAEVLNGTHSLVKECHVAIKQLYEKIKCGRVAQLSVPVSIKGTPSIVVDLVRDLLQQRSYKVRVDSDMLIVGI